ncbi:hypothetical protein JCM6882_009087 [Rhodosporidiobolus microsporus]
MLFSASFVALAAVLPVAFTAPLSPRQDSAATCTLQLNQTFTGTIVPALEDLRSRWTPLTEDGKVVSATVNSYGYAEDAFFNIVPTDSGHKIQPASDPSLCAAFVDAGVSPIQLSMVDCDSEDALWSITCTECQVTGGDRCQLHPTGKDALCASRPYVDGFLNTEKPIELVDCVGQDDDPYSWGQYFSVGYTQLQ